MATITLAISGTAAESATEELMAFSELEGAWKTDAQDTRELTLATIATIVGIVGGTLGIAEKIYKWYQARQQPASPTLEKVVMIAPDGTRLLLEKASVSDIKAVLDQLASQ